MQNMGLFSVLVISMGLVYMTKSTRIYKVRLIISLIFEFILLFLLFLLLFIFLYPKTTLTLQEIENNSKFEQKTEVCYFTVDEVRALVYEDGSMGSTVTLSGPNSVVNIDLTSMLCEVGTRYKGSETILDISYKGSTYNKVILYFYYVQPDTELEIAEFKEQTYNQILEKESESALLLYRYNFYIFVVSEFIVLLICCYIVYKCKLTAYTRRISLQKMKGANKE